MRGKTSKLIRKVAKKNAEGMRVPMESQYIISRHTNAVELTMCYRQTIKYLKKSYRNGDFTAEDLRAALV